MWPHTYLIQYLVLPSGPVSLVTKPSNYSKPALYLVKTCGVPIIDESEMGNKSVRLGDAVTFNCKVRRNWELSYKTFGVCTWVHIRIKPTFYPTKKVQQMTMTTDKHWLYYNIMSQWQLDIKWQQGQKIKSIAKIFTAIISVEGTLTIAVSATWMVWMTFLAI